ncbi:MAG: VCBS repeat-containing protein [Bryobacteraceae bacterium]
MAAGKPAQFFARRDYPGDAFMVAVADVNNDNNPDVVGLLPPYVSTFFGNGHGTFSQGPISNSGLGVMVGPIPIDLNGDGNIDLIVSGAVNAAVSPNGIGVMFGNGDGTFQPAVLYTTPGDFSIGGIAVGDFNGDGIPDAVTVGESGIWLFTGQGGGVFNPGVLIPMSGLAYEFLVAADFTGDGNLDLAITTISGFILVPGNGNGTFQAPTATYKIPSPNQWIAEGSLLKNGYADVILSAKNGDVYVFLNNGKGVFSETQVSLPGSVGVAIGDINGDGVPDLVNSAGCIAFGEGKGKFAAPVCHAVANSEDPKNVVLAELHEEGVLDIVAAEYSAFSVLLNNGKGAFEDGEWISEPGAGSCAAAADFNGDGKPDLAVPTGNGILILLGTGNANSPYTTGTTIPLSGPGCPIAGDLTGSGNQDIVVGANSLNGVGAYLNNGDATFTLASVVPIGSGILAFGDFNHDGKLDLADSSNQYALGNGDGTFQAPQPISQDPPPMGFTWIAAGDVNNDGYTDVMFTQWDGGAGIYLLLNNQQGGFVQSTIGGGGTPQGLLLSDLTGNGNLDAVVWNSANNSAWVYMGNGKGEFKQGQEVVYPGPDTGMLSIGDVNGDGIPYLLLPADGSLGIAYGLGNGTFAPITTWGLGSGSGQILLENLHGQPTTMPDIVSPDSSGGIMVLLNITPN